MHRKSQERKKREQEPIRPYLKPFETLPATSLNAYGQAKYGELDDATMWRELSKPLPTGGMWSTELCSEDKERQGIGFNRAIHAQVLYCEHQNITQVKDMNKQILLQEVFAGFYEEIDTLLPALKYCLAPIKEKKKEGSAMLRSGSMSTPQDTSRNHTALDTQAKIVYEWLDKKKKSYIRMIMKWQSAAGLTHVSAVYHRSMQCYRYHGNSAHTQGATQEVSLAHVQETIRSRHFPDNAQGTRINTGAVAEDVAGDFGL